MLGRCSRLGTMSGWLLLAMTIIQTGALVYSLDCPKGCTIHGVCQEDQGRCDCPPDRTGLTCDKEKNVTCHIDKRTSTCQLEYGQACLNGCNRHGTCKKGWCHCHKGYYGADCSLSTGPDGKPVLLKDEGYRPNKKGPYVYVYELPPQYNVGLPPRLLDRPLYALMWQRLLSSGHRVSNPDKADYFYVPLPLRRPNDSASLLRVIDIIREHWPYWDKYQGGRHIFVHTGDFGRCELTDQAQRATENSTFLTHWGIHHLPGEVYDLEKIKQMPRSMYTILRSNKLWSPLCHRLGLDIVVPVFVQPISAKEWQLTSTPLHPKAPKRERDITFYFSGRICGDRKEPSPTPPSCSDVQMGYSKGIRAKVHELYHRRPGYVIVPRSQTYGQDMSRSKFCLAPLGGGHGKRQMLVSMMGCIPVVLSDDVYQPFEPEMNWQQFAVMVPEADVEKVGDMLDNIKEEQVVAKQRALRCAAQHMFWSSMFGGLFGETGQYDAFATVMEILRVRLLYPNTPPDQYLLKDEQYRLFMECKLQDVDPSPHRPLCSQSSFDKEQRCNVLCGHPVSMTYWYPGGAACCGADNLAACTR